MSLASLVHCSVPGLFFRARRPRAQSETFVGWHGLRWRPLVTRPDLRRLGPRDQAPGRHVSDLRLRRQHFARGHPHVEATDTRTYSAITLARASARRLAVLKPVLRRGRKNLLLASIRRVPRSYAAITEDWNSDDVGACYLLHIGPKLERSALLRVEVSFSFGG
jgi:hypothetical protein